jgi:hypothetical protein
MSQRAKIKGNYAFLSLMLRAKKYSVAHILSAALRYHEAILAMK